MYIMSRSTSMCILVLIFIVVATTSLFYDSLDHGLDGVVEIDCENETNKFLEGIAKWKEKHVVTNQLVENINECFGVIILLRLSNSFVYFIVATYKLAMRSNGKKYFEFTDFHFYYFWSNFIMELIYLCMIILVCANLQEKVAIII